MRLFPFLLAPLVLLLGCKKSDADPTAQLPPATQTGAGTFGCLVNGQPWTPRGNDGTSNYTVSYDRTYHDGTLNIGAYRLSGSSPVEQVVGFYSDSLRAVGTLPIKKGGRHQAVFIDNATRCHYYSVDAGTYCRGAITITRLDLQVGVVAGTFAFTFFKPGCDSIRVTQRRFDRKL